MKTFIGDGFLLDSELAARLYEKHAALQPIVDFHCHIDPQQIYEDYRFKDLAEAWLGGDHYKWRLMRTCGVPERLITGDATGWEKFLAFATIMPECIGNPVHQWAHLELKRYFDCDLVLSEATAKAIWEQCNQKLQSDPDLSVRGIIRRSKVSVIVTTDDPADTLEWHRLLAQDSSFRTAVHPAWRPDKAMNLDKPGYKAYIDRLAASADYPVRHYQDLLTALQRRLDVFDNSGCRASDHGIGAVQKVSLTPDQLEAVFTRALSGESVSPAEASGFRYALLSFLGREYARRGWVMELHYGALRNGSTVNFQKLGPDTGYDSIAPTAGISGIAELLDDLQQSASLPKTLIFSLNPNDNMAINTLAGSFQAEGVRGLVQQGAAWWFNDSKSGILDQLTAYCNASPIGNFLGMLTDSRSFLSYTRHEYFRRLFCSFLAGYVERGEAPRDEAQLGRLVENVCCHNAENYFGY
ncbi:MAG: glucuronate isomerase [Oscillospiraceae bacterium]|nr:glucuronate isomerase [Oscillospiraceae bacterium]